MDIEYTKDRPLRCFFAFEGYNSQGMALERLKEIEPSFEWECVGRSEIDRYAIKACEAVFPQEIGRNYGDISRIDWERVPDFDLFTYSAPCTDISSEGQQRGLEEGSGTRSSLLWECRKAIEIKRPIYLVMENVKALTQKKFLPYLKKWFALLDEYGYTSYTKVLNAKDYGVPQNRERVFVVSVLGNEPYEFPKPFALDKRLKDVLETNDDEKYYLSDRFIHTMTRRTEENKKKGNGFAFILRTGDDIAAVVKTRAGNQIEDNFIVEPNIIQIGNISEEKGFSNPQCGRVYDPNGICPTLNTMQGGGREPKIIEPKCVGYTRDSKGKVTSRHLMDVCNTIHGSTGSGGNTDCFVAEPFNTDKDGLCRTIKAQYYKNGMANFVGKGSFKATGVIEYKGKILKEGDGLYVSTTDDLFRGGLDGVSRTLKANVHDAGVVQDYRIRKLTERECFRLMGVSDSDIDKIQSAGISKTQQYKMAGNSIVVDVLYHIFRKMFIDKEQTELQLTLF